MRRYIIAVILLFAAVACKGQTSKKAEQQEDKAYEALEQIAEVQGMIKNDTDKVWPLMMRTIQRPNERFKYYWIEVGHQNGQRFIAQYHFYILPPKMEVFYKDPMSETLYTPEEWRAKDK